MCVLYNYYNNSNKNNWLINYLVVSGTSCKYVIVSKFLVSVESASTGTDGKQKSVLYRGEDKKKLY